MKLKYKCRQQKKEIERLWKMVEWPRKKIDKGDVVMFQRAFIISQLEQSFDPEYIIDEQLLEIRRELLRKLRRKEGVG